MIRNQQKYWIKEYSSKKHFPGIHRSVPSSTIVEFESYLQTIVSPSKISILDLGCGSGRNSFYLANKGYGSILGIDFATNAILKANKNNKSPNLKFNVLDISKPWKVIEENSIDVIIDINSSFSVRNIGRKNIIKESLRVLKNDGYYFFVGVGRTKWCDIEPGPEINSTVFSKAGKFEKQYQKEELLNTYKNFKLIKFDSYMKHSNSIAGQSVDYPVLTAIFKKVTY